jgi:hypothetical protein
MPHFHHLCKPRTPVSRRSVAQPRLAVQVLLTASPPASTARRVAISRTRRPAPFRRQQQRQPPRFRRTKHAPAPGAGSAPSRPWTGKPPGGPAAKSRGLRSPGALTPSAGRGKPPRQLTALGGLPGRLTRRLLHSSAPLRYRANGSAPTRSYAPFRTAAQNRRDRRGPRRRESGQLLLRLRCSCLRVWTSAELPALTAAPKVSLTSGRPCSALGLTARPAAHRATAWRCARNARSEKSAAPATRYDRRQTASAQLSSRGIELDADATR